MNQSSAHSASALRVLADLSSASTKKRGAKANLIGRGTNHAWEGTRHLGCFVAEVDRPVGWMGPAPTLETVADRDKGNHLAAIDALQPSEHILRLGWLWFSGKTIGPDNKEHLYCLPAISVPVILDRGLRNRTVKPAGDPTITDLVDDPEVAAILAASANFGRGHTGPDIPPIWLQPELQHWAQAVAEACQLTISQWAAPTVRPLSRKGLKGLAAIAGTGLYVSDSTPMWSRRVQLLEWSKKPTIDKSAFAAAYNLGHAGAIRGAPSPDHIPTRALNQTQRAVLVSAVRSPITTVSGPPGTGKTHTVAEIALAAIDRGESVLVGANSTHAVEVLNDHFTSTAGPRPITFGGRSSYYSRPQILSRLNSGVDQQHVSTARHTRDAAAADHAKLSGLIERMLVAEYQVSRLLSDPASRLDMEDRLARAGDLNDLRDLLHEFRSDDGVFGKLRRSGRQRELRRRLSLTSGAEPPAFRAGMADLDNYLLARRILAEGGLTLVESFDQLTERDDALQAASARWLDAAYRSGPAVSAAGRQALSEIATAVAAGREKRRQIFASLDASALGDAAPLWLGVVRDIDDVLPAVPALFDLVVLDEASQIDQPAAAGALLRAKRAVVCGDPQQLRHVSFVGDDEMTNANVSHVAAGGSPIDVRRNSIFDVASGAGNGFQLDEHYRCDPHLIDFSARRFYKHDLHVATATPLNHDADHIDVVEVAGTRDKSKVNHAQIDEALKLIARLIEDGVRGIGVITPFRDQADAMTKAVVKAYRADDIEDYGLAVGTVHAFQGAEHNVVIALFTLGPDESAGSWRFVNKPNLFNVMVTRARRKMIVLNSAPDPPGLAGEYIRHADPLSRQQETKSHSRLWPTRVAAALADTGLDFWPNYFVGKHRLDFALVKDGKPTALIVEPHPEGATAHADRELALRRLGWVPRDAFESRWSERLGELAVTLS